MGIIDYIRTQKEKFQEQKEQRISMQEAKRELIAEKEKAELKQIREQRQKFETQANITKQLNKEKAKIKELRPTMGDRVTQALGTVIKAQRDRAAIRVKEGRPLGVFGIQENTKKDKKPRNPLGGVDPFG